MEYKLYLLLDIQNTHKNLSKIYFQKFLVIFRPKLERKCSGELTDHQFSSKMLPCENPAKASFL